MRYIVTKGTPLKKFFCPACGQVELLTEDEKPLCSNCGTKMPQVVLTVREQESSTTRNVVGDVEPKHKGGRPRKNVSHSYKNGTCSTCAQAMKAETGYTCKIDITSKRSDDSCGLYLEGTPID